jgi:peptidoglycan/LPS O-acetylase OafA/YrhL
LIFPFAVALLNRHPGRNKVLGLLIGLFIFGMVLRAALWISVLEPAREATHNFGSLYDQYIYYPTFTHFDGLLIGIALALLKIYRPRTWERWLLKTEILATIATTALLIGCFLNQYKYSILGSILGSILLFPMISFGFGALLLLSLSPRSWLSRAQLPGISSFAMLSYGIYLVQKLVFHWCEAQLPAWGIVPFSYIGFVVIVAACIVAAAVLYLIVERPAMHLRQKLI